MACGSDDEGKSLLINCLLSGAQQIFDTQLAEMVADSKRRDIEGKSMDFASPFGGQAGERGQGITINALYRFFSTSRRKFIVADTPDNEQYVLDMVTGAFRADVAIILVDAGRGVNIQTRRNAYLVSLMGIRHVVLAINKMNLVGFSPEPIKDIEADFRGLPRPHGFETITAIPVSVAQGDNIITRSGRPPWYAGPTLMGYLETVSVTKSEPEKTVYPVQWVNRPHADFRGFSGTLASGNIKVDDEVRVTSSGQLARVARIVTASAHMDVDDDSGSDLPDARAGDAITLVLDRDVDVSRGDFIALAQQPLEMTDQFEATLVWMADVAGLMGRTYDIKLATQWATASVTALKYRINTNTQVHEPCRQLTLNDIAVANLALSKPLVFDAYTASRTLGGFILVDKFTHATVAAGMIRHNLRRAQNVHRQALSITREDRERRNGHKARVIWFTGLSGSGKSTLANALEKELHALGKSTYVLDGDNVRQGLNKDLGFTNADRVENIRRVAEVAKLMMDAGMIVMTAFISPFRAEREMARQLIGEKNFVEVFVNTPLEVCEQRDPKGLYKKARTGQLPNMSGIDSPYEIPVQPEATINGNAIDIRSNIGLLMQMLDSGK